MTKTQNTSADTTRLEDASKASACFRAWPQPSVGGPSMSIAATPIGRLPGFHQLRIVATQRRQTGRLAREHRDNRDGNSRAAHVVSQGPNVPGRVPAWELASSHQYYSRSPGDQTDIATVMGGGGIEWLILFYRASERVFTARVRA
jgi:hypothetical protein